MAFAKFLDADLNFYDIKRKDQIIAFLDTKIKNSDLDPDSKWIATWNDYLGGIKYFLRWLYNCKIPKEKNDDMGTR
ncbi:MAG: hypothetical protein WBP64_16450 [Nitrososphaeraceae archaeon]|jgi:hypothetical protein